MSQRQHLVLVYGIMLHIKETKFYLNLRSYLMKGKSNYIVVHY